MGYNVEYISLEFPLERTHTNDSGFDIKANISSDVILLPTEIKVIETGIEIELPKELEGQIRPKAALAAKHGVTVLNSPGTLDPKFKEK